MGDHVHEDFRRVRPPLQGSLIRLRAVEESDLPILHPMFNDPQVLAFLQVVTFPQPISGTRGWWEWNRHNEHGQGFVIETLSGEVVGACSLESIRDRSRVATLGIWIGRPYWNMGFGTPVRTACRSASADESPPRRAPRARDEPSRAGARTRRWVSRRRAGSATITSSTAAQSTPSSWVCSRMSSWRSERHGRPTGRPAA